MQNGEVYTKYTPVEQKQHIKHENDQWRLLGECYTAVLWQVLYLQITVVKID